MSEFALTARQAGRDATEPTARSRRGHIDLERLVVFNEQVCAFTRADMPIPQLLDLLAGNIRNRALVARILAVRPT